MTQKTPGQVLDFWFNTLSDKDWFTANDAVDAQISEAFLPTWETAAAGVLESWTCQPESCLAYLLVTDQFSRNLHRGRAESFATDFRARQAARRAISLNWDLRYEGAARHFFYMPLMHSEFLPDQERAVRMFLLRMEDPRNLLHARAHREVIRTYSRFPFRNDALGRQSTELEQAYLENGAYGSTVRALEA